jgi:hypothetical protein
LRDVANVPITFQRFTMARDNSARQERDKGFSWKITRTSTSTQDSQRRCMTGQCTLMPLRCKRRFWRGTDCRQCGNRESPHQRTTHLILPLSNKSVFESDMTWPWPWFKGHTKNDVCRRQRRHHLSSAKLIWVCRPVFGCRNIQGIRENYGKRFVSPNF